MAQGSIGKDGKQRQAKLTHRFRQQQQFAEDYSPLYAALFGTVSDWLTYLPHWRGRPIFGTMTSIINTNLAGFIHTGIRYSGCRE